ncbi:TIGR01777 family oxidoreductase [Luteolibacter algae]|uniref:TIGR01777 family oxidoreductase n=1 Tax=Luteolibacter algae TaxID=454151 RepID=A0ABW5D4Y6_9BACT
MNKRAVLYGASGFVGSGLANMLAKDGWEVTGVSRKGRGSVEGVKHWMTPEAVNLSNCDLVINLAGVPIDQRWTDENKKMFHRSRVGVTQDIVEKIAALPEEYRPKILINTSAVGFYGDRGDDLLTENASQGSGYLADLCSEWETAAEDATPLGLRVVRFRIGFVLGKHGQAFEKLRVVFKSGFGGKLGNGKQWMPWIHVDDLRRAMMFCIAENSISGAVNGCGPNPETNAEFTRKFAKSLHRWAFLPVPGFALKIVMGDFTSALLSSQRAIPEKLLQAGFRFQFEHLETAFDDLTQL